MYLRKLSFLTVVLASFLILSGVACSQSSADFKVMKIKSVKTAESGKAVDFAWEDNGKTYSFSELTKNKVVFINFWGTWCPPCRKEIPDIIALTKELKGKDFVVIGMASERTQPDVSLKNVTEFGNSKGINYINFVMNEDIRKAYGGLPFIPQTFIIDKKGNITEKIDGGRSKEAFLESINKVLK